MSPLKRTPLGQQPPAAERWRNNPVRLAECHRLNHDRMRQARRRWPYIPVRVVFQVGKVVERGARPYVDLRGQTKVVRIPEPVDVDEFLADFHAFMVSWRPSRLRSEAGQAAARDCLARWGRLGADLRR